MVDEIQFSITDNVRLRPACVEDTEIYFDWVSDEVVRQQSFHSKPILWEDHKKWFKEKLLLNSCLMFVMEVNDKSVGQIRFDIENNVAYIDYSLDKKVRGKGLGAVLVNQGIKLVPNNSNLLFHAEVKRKNIESAKIFLKLNFDEKNNSNSEVRVFQLQLIT
ncbi:MAG: GNAT family N-acetyltransferase [Gammaproteobacteria bacterium]|nr:GNAT family N-acetyltransferase [Gammaproteobacteria bacterium]